MRLIDADDLLTAFPVDDEPTLTKSCVRMTIQRMPTIEPRKGKWIDREENMEGMTLMIKRCSECGASKPMKIFSLEDYKLNFCPNCGAQMEKGEEQT